MDYDGVTLAVGFPSLNRAALYNSALQPTNLVTPDGVTSFGVAVAVSGNRTLVTHTKGCALFIGGRLLWNASVPGLSIGAFARAAIVKSGDDYLCCIASGTRVYIFVDGVMRDSWESERSVRGLWARDGSLLVTDNRAITSLSLPSLSAAPATGAAYGATQALLTRGSDTVYALSGDAVALLASDGRAYTQASARAAPVLAPEIPAGQTQVSLYGNVLVTRLNSTIHALRTDTRARATYTGTSAIAADGAVFYVNGGEVKRSDVSAL